MKAVKMSVEMERKLKEAEEEIARQKALEAERAEKAKAEPVKEENSESKPAESRAQEIRKLKKDVIAKSAVSYMQENGVYFAVLLVALVLALTGSFYLIRTGFMLTEGLGGVQALSGEILLGVGLILIGIALPIGAVLSVYFLFSGKKDEKVLCIVPLVIVFVIAIVFLFVV